MGVRGVLQVPSFFQGAHQLRRSFDERFAYPEKGGPERFVWDYWNIPEQYTLLRTPAQAFFPAALFRKFHTDLVLWGREHLGCHDVTPMWLSCYVEGCEQKMHADIPHGPWAFVYSLTEWERRIFSGGETFLLNDGVLDYWRSFGGRKSLESKDAFQLIPPRFNQLSVFDPRVPHGVRPVRGVTDVRHGRLVIHGWFVNPRPFVQGPLRLTELQEQIEGLNSVLPRLPALQAGAHGALSFRLAVSASGKVTSVKILTETLRILDPLQGEPQKSIRKLVQTLKDWKFSARKSGSKVTLPIIFDFE